MKGAKMKTTVPLSFNEGDLADASGLPRQTIAAARKSGELPATKSGRRWIILREDAEAWLRRCRAQGEIPTPISQADRARLAELNRTRKAVT
jgi:excisionase family DNA binding protein